MTHFSRGLLIAGLLLGAWVAPLLASDPMGVYCIVDKVVLEPAARPDRAEVWGTCATAIPEMGGLFDRAARGYFYYAVPAGRADLARAEWADLKTVAGTGEIVSFGARYLANGRFRKATEEPVTPDPYPIHLGVVRLTNRPAGWLLASMGNAGTGKMVEELKATAKMR